MIPDIYYIFNKKDYFNYFFITVFTYILIKNTAVFTLSSLVPIIVTCLVLYILLKNKTTTEFSKLDNLNNKLKKIQIYKYPYLDTDMFIIECIDKLYSLSYINRLKFNIVLECTNRFFRYHSMFQNKNLKPSDLYTSAKDNSKRVLNALKSFVIDIDKYPYLEDDRIVSKDKFITDNNNIYACSQMMENRFSTYLTEMEKKINDNWEKGNINVYSSPIYPDDEEGITESDILHSSKYSVY
tara:strand:+ start:1452 stop:2171 length:720 start_codon:yes stop_codon:yes gene_type:complete